MKKITRQLILIATLLFLFQFLIQPVLAEEEIVVEFFYSSDCGTCTPKKEIVEEVEEQYIGKDNTIIFQIKNIATNENYKQEYLDYQKNYSVSFPFVAIRTETNLTIISSGQITVDYLNETIAMYLAGLQPNATVDKDSIEFDFLFWQLKINVSSLSLPVLAIILGGLDSFNPCSFFILLFLLNLLLYVRSRRRMLLIGGIFIFFSGFFYFLFMVLLYNSFLLTAPYIETVTIIVGIIALSLGIVNIKDFFFFKKGPSLSIPESKKPGVYKRMRELVKTPYLPAVIAGTIVLAITVNFYELICTAVLPVVFVTELIRQNLPEVQSYWYIFSYNIVYVIPLITIVLIFVFTLGRKKLSEWGGRMLKLLSGLMMSSFGLLFIVDYKLLENVVTPILLLAFSLIATVVISFIWKRFHGKKEEDV